MIPVRAVLDACVLYPPSLRDYLMWLAVTGVYAPRFSEEIHREWMRSVLRDHPHLTESQLQRTRQLMDAIDPEGLVVGYEPLIVGLSLPDADDRHVLAAAIASGAGAIVTFNRSDFPATALRSHGIRALHPDTFLHERLSDPATAPGVIQATRACRANLTRPPKNAKEFLQSLRGFKLTKTVTALELFADQI